LLFDTKAFEILISKAFIVLYKSFKKYFHLKYLNFVSKFSGAISCCPLYLFIFKEKIKRMPLPSGLGL